MNRDLALPPGAGPLVSSVKDGSPAARAGIRAGWTLLQVDGQDPGDILDYLIEASDNRVELDLRDENGEVRRLILRKRAGAPCGLSFTPPTIIPPQLCCNNCIFCFVEQNPPGLREALYFKDDDYRMSFLYGNYITLNCLGKQDLKRILALQLSPLYVSVHATSPRLRQVIFRSAGAWRGLDNLHRLLQGGIKIHAQVVLCPGYNTGTELFRTLYHLYKMGPNLLSVALVPVGLTAYRAGLPQLRSLTAVEARDLIATVAAWQRFCRRRRGSRFVFAADELYLLAGVPLPPHAAYEQYQQLENGVGLGRLFLRELNDVKRPTMATAGSRRPRVTIVTSRAAEPLIHRLTSRSAFRLRASFQLVVARNSFFGEPVSVAGLLAGSDILRALQGRDLGEAVYCSDRMLNDRGVLFLDNLSLRDLALKLGRPLYPVSGPRELARHLDALGHSDSAATGPY